MGFNRPSKIQERALPLLLADPPENFIAQSQSGTGKTAAFVLAMLSRVDTTKSYPQVRVRAWVLVCRVWWILVSGKLTHMASACELQHDITCQLLICSHQCTIFQLCVEVRCLEGETRLVMHDLHTYVL